MPSSPTPSAIVVGAGPAGLMAAETLQAAGIAVQVYDSMPSAGRKFLLAGIGGLNLTHAEPLETFVTRYGNRSDACARWLERLSPQALRDWARGLGIETFVGSSHRVFPTDMKAAPLLRAWLHRLRHPDAGVGAAFHMRHRWTGHLERQEGRLRLDFEGPQGPVVVQGDVVILALGGASWPRLGSTGQWAPWLASLGLEVAPLRPSNCGFDAHGRHPSGTGWSAHFASRHAGQALKSVVLEHRSANGGLFRREGECVLTATGLEGSLVYAASAALRDSIERNGRATLHLDLRPQLTVEQVHAALSSGRGKRSLSSHLKGRLGLTAAQVGLLYEQIDPATLQDNHRLAHAIKHLPIELVAPRPVEEAISSAGGVRLESLDAHLMARDLPGLFMAGEMLDWEAPTGGYLLTACLASGRVAGEGATRFLRLRNDLSD